MTPAPPASKRALLRRVYFDLIGLPPTPDEIAPSRATRRPTPTRKLSTNCWPIRATASDGHGIGWIWRDLPNPTASPSMANVPPPGAIAIT